MYLAVDIGGTKTLLASFSTEGKLLNEVKIPTAKRYAEFLQDFAKNIQVLGPIDYHAVGVAIPGKVDREHGRGVSFGNLPWKNVPIEADIQSIVNAPVVVENDAKLGGLSEAINIKNEFKRVLYVAIGTGIGVALINDDIIDAEFGDGGGHDLILEYQGKMHRWDAIASGKAIVKKYGVKAENITAASSWKNIAHGIAVGLSTLIAMIQPEAIVISGGVGQFYDRFSKYLTIELKKYDNPLFSFPSIRGAKRPQEAVLYGCYEIVKQHYGRHSS